MTIALVEPSHDCPLCPRLEAFRNLWREREPGWFNAPVPTFMPPDGPNGVRLLIVGLAPGLRGANRTGRPFTGDYAGDLLYSTLIRFGLARGRFLARPDDGLELVGTAIINAVRCVPPEGEARAEGAVGRRLGAGRVCNGHGRCRINTPPPRPPWRALGAGQAARSGRARPRP